MYRLDFDPRQFLASLRQLVAAARELLFRLEQLEARDLGFAVEVKAA